LKPRRRPAVWHEDEHIHLQSTPFWAQRCRDRRRRG
jgi:hypothetical protein